MNARNQMLPATANRRLESTSVNVGLTPDARQTLMRSMKEFAGGQEGVPIEFEIVEGHAAAAIVAKASELPADLLVLGTHGRSGFERWVLGSVTEKVLRKSLCPVLTVPRHAGVVADEPIVFRHVVCAVDFSECSMHAVDYAISLAEETHASLTLVHVIELPPDIPREVHENVLAGPRNFREYVALAEQEGRARLTDAVPDRVRASLTVDTVLTAGKPYREILRVAAVDRHRHS